MEREEWSEAMRMFEYCAVAADGGVVRGVVRGPGAGTEASDLRAALRGAGLRVVSMRERRGGWWSRLRCADRKEDADGRVGLGASVREMIESRLQRRRVGVKAELLDDLATLLDTGVPLAEAMETIGKGSNKRVRGLLESLADRVRSGTALSAAMSEHRDWFDAVDAALVETGEQAGALASVLRGLCERHSRSSELGQRVVAALGYPIVVFAVGIGVVLFLSNVTLPKLAGVLIDAKVQVPPLTRMVMGLGQSLFEERVLAIASIVGLVLAGVWARAMVARGRIRVPNGVRALVPSVLRRVALASALKELADVLRCGLPLVEALRVVAPTASGLGALSLRMRLEAAAGRVERGDNLADTLDDPLWFGPSLRRAIAVGEAGGDLPDLLERVATAEARRCKLLIDRLTGWLEPAAILTLAVLIGVVVMAAIQPLIRLQEVIR